MLHMWLHLPYSLPYDSLKVGRYDGVRSRTLVYVSLHALTLWAFTVGKVCLALMDQ